MKNKNEKNKDLEDLKKTLADNKNIFVTGYEKMTVEQDFELRKTIRDAGGEYEVVKNNWLRRHPKAPRPADLLG